MPYFYWNEKFETGEKTIDKQHRALVDLINKLSTAISHKGTLLEVEETLTALLKYTNIHFRYEEAVMLSSNLPAAEKQEHLQAHSRMIAEIETRIQMGTTGEEEIRDGILPFLNSWLIKHILGADMRMVDTLKNPTGATKPEPSFLNMSRVEQILLNALNESERRFHFFTDSAPVMVWISDSRGKKTFFNKSWHAFVGKAVDLYQGNWSELIHPDDRADYERFSRKLTPQSQNAECEYRMRHNDGNYRYLLERVMPRFETDNAFIGYISSTTDISIQKESEQLLAHMNQKLGEEVLKRTREIETMLWTDHLTHVGNRRFLLEKLDKEIKRSERYNKDLSLLFIDIDHFKSINDNYGHEIGDQFLIETAKALKKETRDIDAFGRFGGEEFLVILPETSAQGATIIGERMRARIKNTKVKDIDREITVSIGVAERKPKEAAKELIKRADGALYTAKKEGRDRVSLAD